MAASTRRRVLVVEDDLSIRELLRLHLTLTGFDIDETDDGAEALALVRATPYDLLILDVMLPGIDGVTVCRAIRAGDAHSDTPILMLTARDAESDTVLGLESGADDYVTKPFGVRELMARVGALLRRARTAAPPEAKKSGRVVSSHLQLDPERRKAIVRGEAADLTRQEFDVLYLLASRPGVVYSRAALIDRIWSHDSYVTDRTVDAVISRLRRKIERNPQNCELILTAWGVGYKFADSD